MFFLRLRAFVFLLFLVFVFESNSINAQTEKNEQAAEPPEEILIFRTSPGIEDQAEGCKRAVRSDAVWGHVDGTENAASSRQP